MVALADMRQIIRRMTARYTPAQMTDSQIDTKINLFYTLYFPEEFKNLKLTKPYVFVTTPNVDTYNFPYQSGLPGNQPGNITVQPPVYAQGYLLRYFQDRTTFYNRWPKLTNLFQIDTGLGTVGPYSGIIPFTPMLRRSEVDIFGNLIESAVLITAQTSGYNLVLRDTPLPGEDIGSLIDQNGNVVGAVYYLTGQYEFTTENPIPSGVVINVQTIPYQPSRPYDVLFWNQQFVFRPVPADIYQIEFTISQQPTQLIADTDAPELDEWYLFICSGASKLIYIDFPDPEGLAYVEKIYEEQRCIAQRRTLKQIGSTQRAQTLFSTPTRPNVAAYPGWSLPGN